MSISSRPTSRQQSASKIKRGQRGKLRWLSLASPGNACAECNPRRLLWGSTLKMAGAFFRLTDIAKTYPGVSRAGVNFAVSPGEVIGLVGENGAGKSTLMKILGGVIEPTSGTLDIDGVQRTSLTVRNPSPPASPSSTRNSTCSTISMWRPTSISAASRCMAGLQAGQPQEAQCRCAAAARPAGRGFHAGNAGVRAVDRPAAAARDRQGAVLECAPGHHGRADLEPDAD